MNLRHLSRIASLTATATLVSSMLLIPAQSSAQALQPLADFPKQAITIVSPFPPGGGNDKISRLLAAELAGIVGQPVVVENRGGAGGNLGTSSVAKAKPDGYTILTSQTSIIGVNPALYPNAGFVPKKDFEPLSQLTSAPVVFVVRADSPYKSMKDYIADARKRPDVVNFATPGNGTLSHLTTARLATQENIKLTHIPYKGAGPALNDLLGGQVNMMFATATAAAPLIESGKVRALGVTTPGRSPVRPDVPSIAEAGVPGYAAESWYGFFVPAGTSAEIVNKLNAATAKAAQSETFRKRVEGEGLVITTGTPKELADYVSAEQKRWAAVVKAAKIEPN